MLSTLGSMRPPFSFSARAASDCTNSFNSSVAGALRIVGFSPSSFGRGRFNIAAVCTSADWRNICINSGTLMKRAKRVLSRYPAPSGESSIAVTGSPNVAAQESK